MRVALVAFLCETSQKEDRSDQLPLRDITRLKIPHLGFSKRVGLFIQIVPLGHTYFFGDWT